RFTSRVKLDRPNLRIDVAYTDGPFRYLNNHWNFEALPNGGCRIHFYVDFEFRSAMLQRILGLLFNEAVRRMVHPFENPARKIYRGGATGGHPEPQGPPKKTIQRRTPP